MKLLVVGHTYLTAFAQSKYVAMKAAHPELRLRLVIPPKMPHPFKLFAAERHAAFTEDEVAVVPTLGGRSHMSYVLNPWRLYQIIRSFQPDHIHIEEDPHSLAGFETALLARFCASSATVSFFIWDNLARTPRFPLGLIKRFLTGISLSRADVVVCGNTEGARLLREVKGYRGRTVVLPQLGIDEHDYQRPIDKVVRRKFLGHAPWIGFVGRLVPEKGVRHLLAAMATLQDLPWRLLIVGSGSLREEIERQWLPVLKERMVLLDAVSHSAVADHLRCLDVFVLPSYEIEGWKEQFGLTLAQAMLAGVACVGSDSGAIPEVIDGAGLIVPAGESEALAGALRRLLSSPELLREKKAAARERAAKNYTTDIVAEKYFVLFQATGNPNTGRLL